MKRLIVTADVHGSISCWMTLKSLLTNDDALVVAGDLFDTRFGSYWDPDYQPDHIRDDLAGFDHPLYYVYGNCDEASYFPEQQKVLQFRFCNKTIIVHHGDRPLPELVGNSSLIIQGHTHYAFLDQQDTVIFLNPGSLARPKNGLYTYGIVEKDTVMLVDLKTGAVIARRNF